MKLISRLISASFVIALIAACSDDGGSGGSATPCSTSSECPANFECVITNSNANATPERPLAPGYTIQSTCDALCAKLVSDCGAPPELLPSCIAGCGEEGLSSACLSCVTAAPDLCTSEDFPPECQSACSGGQGGSGGGGGAAGAAGSGPAGSGGSSGSSQGGSAGSNAAGTTSGGGTAGTSTAGGSGGSANTAKPGICKAKASNAGGSGGTSSQGGSGGTSSGVSCEALCNKASSCDGFDASLCAKSCPQITDGCRSCIFNAQNICATVAGDPNSTICLAECSSGQGGSSGSGGTSSEGGSAGTNAGGSDPAGSGGTSSSESTCTINDNKFNCPSPAAAQQCFETGAPGSCTPALSPRADALAAPGGGLSPGATPASCSQIPG